MTALFEKAPLASSRAEWEKLLPWNIIKFLERFSYQSLILKASLFHCVTGW